MEADATDRMRHATAPALRGNRRAIGADPADGDVIGERRVEEDDLALRVGGALLQLIEARHHENRSGDAILRRADAASEPEHPKRCDARLNHLDRFRSADPARDHHRLAADLLEPILCHLGENPVDRRLEARRATQPVAERVHQTPKADVCQTIAGGGAIDAVRDGAIGRGDGGLLGVESGGNDRDEEKDQAGNRAALGRVHAGRFIGNGSRRQCRGQTPVKGLFGRGYIAQGSDRIWQGTIRRRIAC